MTDYTSRPRHICASLTLSMRKCLRARKGTKPAIKGLKDRLLICPGDGVVPTEMGSQWRDDLIRVERMERALLALRDKIRDGAEKQEMLDIIAGATL